MANVLDTPVPKVCQCCCGPCDIQTGCTLLTTGGIEPKDGFYGLCCSCQPKRACVSLFVLADDDGCGCGGDDEYRDGDIAISSIQAEWDCDTNSYNGRLSCVNATWPEIDFAIGFEQDPAVDILGGGFRSGNCYIVLKSDCLGYTTDRTTPGGAGTDTRIWVPMGGEYHDNDTRAAGCAQLGYDFDIDLSGCISAYNGAMDGCTTARIRIDPVVREQRVQKVSGYWNGGDRCEYTRVCVTYTEYGGPSQTVYACSGTAYEGNGYNVIFENVEGVEEYDFDIDFDALSPTTLSLSHIASSGQVVTCPHMQTEWTLASGATIAVRGDQRADCVDCQCWCPCICVEYFNSDVEGVFRGTLCWDEEYGGWAGDLENVYDLDAYPISIALNLFCDECTGVTKLRMQVFDHDLLTDIDCDELEAFYEIAEEDESNTQVSVSCRKCAECFEPFGLSVGCCPDDPIPDTLYATIEPDDADYDPGPPPIPGNGKCDDIDTETPIPLEYQGGQPGGGLIDEWWGSGFPFLGCPDKRLYLQLRCKEIVDEYSYIWEMTAYTEDPGGENQTLDSDATACDPLEIVFRKFFVGSSDLCCNPSIGSEPNNYKVTVTA